MPSPSHHKLIRFRPDGTAYLAYSDAEEERRRRRRAIDQDGRDVQEQERRNNRFDF